ncbi:MAG TPA: DUF4142 domain-containing protein [Flavipsychrobacter sp.]
MKKTIFNTLLLAALLSAASCGNNNETDSKEIAEEQNEAKLDDTHLEKDAEFAVAAADGGMMEVELGKLAATNAASAQVKEFAQGMVTDHSQANEELKSLAASKNIALPATLSEDKQKKVNELAEKKGADFDKAYMDFMVDDHEEDIKKFQDEADNGNDAEIKGWASGKVPVLQHHLEMAKTTRDAVKK